MLRVASKLDDELERLVHRTIGCCIAIVSGLRVANLQIAC